MGNNKSPEEKSGNIRQTRFSDVCGSVDEFKRLLNEEYDRVSSEPGDSLVPLVEDAVFMVGRMLDRTGEYEHFKAELTELFFSFKPEPVDKEKFNKAVSDIKKRLSVKHGEISREEIEYIEEKAEEIRLTGGQMEKTLRAYKDLALKAYELLENIRGGRPWLFSNESGGSLIRQYEKKYQAWLPPGPHRIELLKWIAAGRAVVKEEKPGEDPLVLFEDGGMLYMSQARYDRNVKNFHPRLFAPGPGGRRYRKS